MNVGDRIGKEYVEIDAHKIVGVIEYLYPVMHLAKKSRISEVGICSEKALIPTIALIISCGAALFESSGISLSKFSKPTASTRSLWICE